MSLKAVLVAQHATGHLATMSGAAEPLLADRVLAGLGEAQLPARPAPCLNAIAWVLWHLARSEDVLVNVLLTDGPQILDAGGWSTRLGLTERDMGTGMTSAQVDAINARVALPALLDYMVAVGRRTRAVLAGLQAADWVGAVEPERLLAAGAFADPAEGARRVATFWRAGPGRSSSPRRSRRTTTSTWAKPSPSRACSRCRHRRPGDSAGPHASLTTRVPDAAATRPWFPRSADPVRGFLDHG